MKILTIGDLHGKDCWKNINPNKYDKIIFLGDYVDSFDINNLSMIANLKAIIKFKKDYPDKIVLLWGNHDVGYYLGQQYGCSGFRPEIYPDLHKLFSDNQNLFTFAYQIKRNLWTHAGVHANWYKHYFKLFDTEKNLVLSLNKSFSHREKSLFMVGYKRGGSNLIGGPLWLDISEGWKNPLKGYHQIVGHHYTNDIKTNSISNKTSITYCDVLDTNDSLFYEKII